MSVPEYGPPVPAAWMKYYRHPCQQLGDTYNPVNSVSLCPSWVVGNVGIKEVHINRHRTGRGYVAPGSFSLHSPPHSVRTGDID